ncbi:MAG: CpaF/VirB11 family protein [Clostridia bacterium]|nr:CpaF/VirB11 family protein [Clostridia bacterium]
MNNASLFFEAESIKKTLSEVLKGVQEYISRKYSSLISDKADEQKEQIKLYISKYLLDYRLGVEGYSFENLVERIYSEMAEFSFLTKFLFSKDVEEINVNSWKDIKITYATGDIRPTKEHFSSPEHALDVIRRLLHKSGMILDYSQPIIRGHLSNNIRITVFGNPIIDKDKGVAASIRIVNPQKLERKDFVTNGTSTAEMLDFLSLILRYGVSICVTGATSSGKTTIMSWLLSTSPDDKRIFTIENGCREFNLVKEDENGNIVNSVVHTATKFCDDITQNIDQEKLLEFALTSNPDIICVGEMKSAEAFAAQEAARTGHAVITTTHANSCESTYHRMVTLCKQKYDINDQTLYNLVTEAFPIVMFVKKLEDNTRKVMEITECEILPDGSRKIRTLFRFNVKENRILENGVKVIGEFERVSSISDGLKKRLLENGMPLKTLNQFIVGGEIN